MGKLRVLELFAGYGSQSMSLRDVDINHEVVGISEIEPDAIIAYGSIRHNIDDLHTDRTHDEMREELMAKNVGYDFKTGKSKIPRMKKTKLEMLYKFDTAIGNFGDVSIIEPDKLPDFDYMTYSFPCQSISSAGKQEGIIKGETRSGLLYECEKIIENKRPKYLLMENVKALVSNKFIKEFDEWCEYLEGLGYTNYHNNYKCLNAKNFKIPQNRERIFMVSILGEHDEFNMPQGQATNVSIKDILEENVDEKYYIDRPFKLVDKGHQAEFLGCNFEQNARIYGEDNVMRTLSALDRGQNNILVKARLTDFSYKQINQILDTNGICHTLDTMQGGYREPKILCDDKCGYRVRKITPREALRLMGVPDVDIDKIQSVGLSNSALYKLAGNSIVKQVLDELHINMFKKQSKYKIYLI